jgi:DNA-binding MarR family transcriptional regulator
MVRHAEALVRYIELVAGVKPRLDPAPVHAALPLFLRQQFDFAATELFGRRFILAVERAAPEELSASEYARTAAQLKQGLGEEVVLVMAKLPSYFRNRLVQKGVPFIVAGTQMFLPMVMVDLRERFAAGVSRIPDKLLPAAQLVVIYQILREPAASIGLADMGKRLAYSPQSMSSAQEELQEAGLCEVRRAGRMVYLDFGLRGKALWEKAEPLMASPVRRKRWVRWGEPRARAVAAGTTALSRMSMLAEDSVATYAMRDRELTAALENGQLVGCNGREDADAHMESWKYDPWVLAENGAADRCSLYLSLRESGDERVRKEIRSLIEGLPQ